MSGKKKKKKGTPIFVILLVVCLAVAGFSAYKLISIGLTYKAGEDEYADLQKYTVEKTQDTDEASEENTDDAESTPESTEESESGGVPLTVDVAGLKAVNPDFAGWLYIAAEDISYPMVHYTDNDYYLHRTFEKADNFAGTIFIDYQNNGDLTDPNTIIYGHNMKNDSMFGKLQLLYENGDYAKDDTFWIITEEGAYKYRMFSMQVTSSDSPVYTLYSAPCQEFMDYITARASESAVQLPLGEYNENSKVVTLSTCWGTGEDGSRFVVQGILLGVY